VFSKAEAFSDRARSEEFPLVSLTVPEGESRELEAERIQKRASVVLSRLPESRTTTCSPFGGRHARLLPVQRSVGSSMLAAEEGQG
jgi:hypothetical protein